MLNGALARRYAQALFDLAVQIDVLDQISQEVADFADLVAKNQEIGYVLNHPKISLTTKKKIIEDLCRDRVSDSSKHFFYLLIDRRRQQLLPLIAKEFSRMADQARNIVEVKITSATDLASEEREQVSKALAQKTGKNIRLIAMVDPNLIGGAKLQIGDQVIDGSVRTALDKARRELKKASYKPQQEVGVN